MCEWKIHVVFLRQDIPIYLCIRIYNVSNRLYSDAVDNLNIHTFLSGSVKTKIVAQRKQTLI